MVKLRVIQMPFLCDILLAIDISLVHNTGRYKSQYYTYYYSFSFISDAGYCISNNDVNNENVKTFR